MKLYLIEMFGVSLLLTLVIELTIAGLFRISFGKELLVVILVNVLTNPVVVLLCWLWGIYLPQMNRFWIEIPLEVLVVWYEYRIYKSMRESGWCCEKPLRFSLAANGASWIMGVLIAWIR